ncbi:hypothetical protein EV424DRAFT_1332384, partial [Suillus variegatus]
IQTALIQSAPDHLLTDVACDLYGLRLATCSLDQKYVIPLLPYTNENWNVEYDWNASMLEDAWAHLTVKVWEQTSFASTADSQTNGVERAVLVDARSAVRVVEFAPRHFGLKLVRQVVRPN